MGCEEVGLGGGESGGKDQRGCVGGLAKGGETWGNLVRRTRIYQGKRWYDELVVGVVRGGVWKCSSGGSFVG